MEDEITFCKEHSEKDLSGFWNKNFTFGVDWFLFVIWDIIPLEWSNKDEADFSAGLSADPLKFSQHEYQLPEEAASFWRYLSIQIDFPSDKIIKGHICRSYNSKYGSLCCSYRKG